MKYNPQHTGGDKPRHHRRSIRLKGYDYSREGAYFITICCQDRKYRFGKIVGTSPANRRMELNEYGIIAHDEWIKLTERFFNFELDVFQIMPNHMHGIIVLKKSTVGATLAVAPGTGVNPAPTNTAIISVGNIVGAYKSMVANACPEKYKSKNQTMGKFWQRNYYEHIIRDEQSYQRISNYITNNPSNWENDKFYNHKI